MMQKRTIGYLVVYVFFSFWFISDIANNIVQNGLLESVKDGCYVHVEFLKLYFTSDNSGFTGIKFITFAETPTCFNPIQAWDQAAMINFMNARYGYVSSVWIMLGVINTWFWIHVYRSYVREPLIQSIESVKESKNDSG